MEHALDSLTKFLNTIKSPPTTKGDSIQTEYAQYLDLFQSEIFNDFSKNSSIIIAVYNFPKQRYEFISESVFKLYGIKPEKFTTDLGAKAFIEILKPKSMEIMLSEIAPKTIQCCIQHKEQIKNLQFNACLEIQSKKGKEGWIQLHTTMLSADNNGYPMLSYTIIFDVSNIKKDSNVYYAASLSNERETQILYSQNLFGTKNPISFTKREIQILQHLCNGKTTKEIAEKLHIGFETIKKQRANILRKTEVRNTAELINFSTMTGII